MCFLCFKQRLEFGFYLVSIAAFLIQKGLNKIFYCILGESISPVQRTVTPLYNVLGNTTECLLSSESQMNISTRYTICYTYINPMQCTWKYHRNGLSNTLGIK